MWMLRYEGSEESYGFGVVSNVRSNKVSEG